MAIFFNLPLISGRLHPRQVENCDSNSRLVVDENDNGNVRVKSLKLHNLHFHPLKIVAIKSVLIELN